LHQLPKIRFLAALLMTVGDEFGDLPHPVSNWRVTNKA
jgi:hypothetical protein